MSFPAVKAYFESLGMGDRVLEFDLSSATVELAAQVLGCKPDQIAKTMSFLVHDEPIVIVSAGGARIDNAKYKAQFHQKAKMIPWDLVESYTGHAPGGVCPFALKEGVSVYLDESLKRNPIVYPAAGSGHSAVRLSIRELESSAAPAGWIDVCR